MHDGIDVSLVHAHSIGASRGQDSVVGVEEPLFHRKLLLLRHACMVEADFLNAEDFDKNPSHVLSPGAGRAEYYHGLFHPQGAFEGGLLLGVRVENRIVDVRPVAVAFQKMEVAVEENLAHPLEHKRRSRGGERRDDFHVQLPDYLSEREIGGTEGVAPFGDAVRLVDCDE